MLYMEDDVLNWLLSDIWIISTTIHLLQISFRRITKEEVLKTECYIENEGKYLLCLYKTD